MVSGFLVDLNSQSYAERLVTSQVRWAFSIGVPLHHMAWMEYRMLFRYISRQINARSIDGHYGTVGLAIRIGHGSRPLE